MVCNGNHDMNENKLLEVERFTNLSNSIRFSSIAKQNQAASVACG